MDGPGFEPGSSGLQADAKIQLSYPSAQGVEASNPGLRIWNPTCCLLHQHPKRELDHSPPTPACFVRLPIPQAPTWCIDHKTHGPKPCPSVSMPKEGFEPPSPLQAPDSKSGVYTNSTTQAKRVLGFEPRRSVWKTDMLAVKHHTRKGRGRDGGRI